MRDPFSSSDDSSSGVLGAWNLDAAASDDGLDDSLLVPPSPPPPRKPTRQFSTSASKSKDSFASGFPLHFSMRQEHPPSGLEPALSGAAARAAGDRSRPLRASRGFPAPFSLLSAQAR